MVKKCKRKGCNKICDFPAWTYCSDDCGRLSANKRRLDVVHKKLALKNKESIINKVVPETPRIKS